MKKGKNLLAIVLCLAVSYVPMQAAGYYRTKKVQYGGVNIYYNGVYQNAASQSVIIDGTTYLPVKSMANMLGLNVNWDKNSHTVVVNGTTTPTLSAQAELQAKNYEIATLKKELEKLKNEGVVSNTSSSSSSSNRYNTTSGTDILGTEITDTRKALDSRYGDYFDDIDFDFSLSLSSSQLKVRIIIDDSSDYREFNKLSNRDVKDFIEDVCDYIRDRHDNIVISGVIEYRKSNKDLYSFSYSKRDELSYGTGSKYYNTSSSTTRSVRDILDDVKSVKIAGYDGKVYVEDTDYDVNDYKERVEFELYLDITDDIKKAWNEHTGINNDSTLRSYLKEIAEDIEDETDYEEIKVTLYKESSSTKQVIGYYDYDDNELDLRKIE